MQRRSCADWIISTQVNYQDKEKDKKKEKEKEKEKGENLELNYSKTDRNAIDVVVSYANHE